MPDDHKDNGIAQSPPFTNRRTFSRFVRAILQAAGTLYVRGEFLVAATNELHIATGAQWVDFRMREQGHFSQCTLGREDSEPKLYRHLACMKNSFETNITISPKDPPIFSEVAGGHFDPTLPGFTRKGGAWVVSTDINKIEENRRFFYKLLKDRKKNPLSASVLLPLVQNSSHVGLLHLGWYDQVQLSEEFVEILEEWAETITLVYSQRQSQIELRERVKELTCLYGISRELENRDHSTESLLKSIVELLPPAWQYPEITNAQINLDDQVFSSIGFVSGTDQQKSELVIGGKSRGRVEVHYREKRPTLYEGPFLREERSLLETIARHISFVLEEREVRADRSNLHHQLLHADRLATIGQLAAGVAHELNEPLSSIMGFAQLLKKNPELSEQSSGDVERIVNASLHAREVVKKLLIFARKAPLQQAATNLNTLVNEVLFFLEARCSKEGIKVLRRLGTDVVDMQADPSQVRQVIINLVVNALQAMKDKGTLTVETGRRGVNILLTVEDTGKGMNDEELQSIFVPFYTTKDVNEGTGLGLPVVHGIVTSHGGKILVKSKVGQGTRFEIEFPIQSNINASKDY